MTKTVRAAAYAPDGTEITYTSPPNKWDVAGIARSTRTGNWVELAHGVSYDSVRSRAITKAYRWGYERTTVTAVRIYEATAPVVREYFGHHKVSIAQVFKPGSGWQKVSLHGGWSNIRKLSKQGVVEVAFSGDRNGRHVIGADFAMSSLLKSMRLPAQKMCATQGHDHIPATQKITYRYVAEPEKVEFVCQACLDIMLDGEDQGLVASLSAIPLAA